MAKNRPIVTQVIPQDKAPAQKAPEPVAVVDDGLPSGVIAPGLGDESLSAAITDDSETPSQEETLADSLTPPVDLGANNTTIAAPSDGSETAAPSDGSETRTLGLNDLVASGTAATDLRTFDLASGRPGGNEVPDFGLVPVLPSRAELGTPDFGLDPGEPDEDVPGPGETPFGSKESLLATDLESLGNAPGIKDLKGLTGVDPANNPTGPEGMPCGPPSPTSMTHSSPSRARTAS